MYIFLPYYNYATYNYIMDDIMCEKFYQRDFFFNNKTKFNLLNRIPSIILFTQIYIQ